MTFEREIIALQPNLRAFARSICGRADFADDLVQETLLKAFAARESYRAATNMKAWLFTILRNTYLSLLRKDMRLEALPEGNEHALEQVIPAAQEDSVYLSQVFEAIRQLPREQQDTLYRIRFREESYAEAAAGLAVVEGTTKSRVHRSMESLRKKLGEKELQMPRSSRQKARRTDGIWREIKVPEREGPAGGEVKTYSAEEVIAYARTYRQEAIARAPVLPAAGLPERMLIAKPAPKTEPTLPSAPTLFTRPVITMNVLRPTRILQVKRGVRINTTYLTRVR